ncbi:L [Tanga virus]|uniref:RNA-directed RNA polymerase L n=1 Tax=Tanga virus TaxID=2748249 RepID=A0A7D9MVU1_9VIRU|nr:L [Tanga virus] [Tanga virus]QLA47025.1 L [Tanga virus] [Tanga virus]
MEARLYQEYLARINAARTADVAKDIDVDLLVERHNYFGRCVCESLNIEYKNDVPLVDIICELFPDEDMLQHNIPNITPDNYLIINNMLYIIDYKVTVSMETVQATLTKYNKALEIVAGQLPINYEIVIIKINPINKELYISSDSFRALYPGLTIDVDFNPYFDLKRILYDKFENDDEFLLKISHGDFTLTSPWLNEDTPELYSHPIYVEFINSMPVKYSELFWDSMEFNSYSAERWNFNLYRCKEATKGEYDAFIRAESSKLFECNGDYPKPTSDEILKGWDLMTERVKETRDLLDTEVLQKPSIHFLWGSHDDNSSNENNPKILRLAKMMKTATGDHPMLRVIQQIGDAVDFSEHINEYETHCINLKMESRLKSKPINYKKIDTKQFGKCYVRWEQQFILNSDNMDNEVRRRLMKDFAGIGRHKVFKNKTLEDIDLGKPKILDFNKESIYLASLKMMNSFKDELSKDSTVKRKDTLLEEYVKKIGYCNQDTADNIDKLIHSKYWDFITDYSTIMKNMLAMSQYNKHNTIRIATCANNNVFGILLPSSDIKTKRATIVYFIVVLHKEDVLVCNPGTLLGTFKCSKGYLSFSKALRLDKERCQRIVSSPGLFLLTTLLMHDNNPTIKLFDVANFSLFTSCSITKSLLSLTEPARYMIMNSLALSSNVKDYISEKFSPYTKTLFSVYMTRLIKNGCLSANNQQRRIAVRDIHLTEYDITQKGMQRNRDINSIWFPGLVNIQEYLEQVYMPFYFNAKGLHEKHHVMIDLVKTVGEIELEQRINCEEIWSDKPKKQTVNLPILIHSLAKQLIQDTSRHNHLRDKIESRNNFRKLPVTVSTFTSSKSCVQVGDFKKYKISSARRTQRLEENIKRSFRIANPMFFEDNDTNKEIRHANYEMLRDAIPDFIDYITTKNFDRLYNKITNGDLEEKSVIELAMDMMKNHKELHFAMFNKGQKTFKDREIFEPEWETKLCMYPIERIAKERCKLNPDEMISEPGDGKLKILEQKSEQELRFMIQTLKELNSTSDILLGKLDTSHRGTKLEINADMSKWSAQDVYYKYFWLIALDPILYPFEKKRILYFMCNYMQKKLIIPDDVMTDLLDQKSERPDDIFRELTNNFARNWFFVKRNWLQGNFNYISSYLHSTAMNVYKDIVKNAVTKLDGKCLVNSLVHSDDNQTSISIIQNKIDEDKIIQFCRDAFETICLTFGCQANMKKTYITNSIKEFVSLFNLCGEPYSVYGRFLLTSVGDCAYLGPYEDLANRISATQTAIKHGCPPSYAWLSLYLAQWITYYTYSMLPRQKNDPCLVFDCSRLDLPPELCGLIESDLSTISLVGLEADNLTFLIKLLQKMSPILLKKEPVLNQMDYINNWDLSKCSYSELLRLKLIRYFHLDDSMSNEDPMGETSEMRSRSLLTPRKFTTAGSLLRLKSYNDYQDIMSDEQATENLIDFILERPDLLVTKGETYEEYKNMVLYRYNSKKFKESLSVQNPAQLFIEQILFSHKPTIDYNFLRERFLNINDTKIVEEFGTISGRLTFHEAYRSIREDMSKLPLTTDDIQVVYQYMIANDPLLLTVGNSLVMSTVGCPQERNMTTACTMPEFRNLKLIHYSPAVVLKAFAKRTLDLPGTNPDELQRDIMHLETFLESTELVKKMEMRILENETKLGKRDRLFELKEKTKLYQICYEYIKSTEHKIKVFILPIKCRTSYDFCAVIQGNLISDSNWYSIHYLKQINTGGYKGIMQRTVSQSLIIAQECFRALTFFTDSFIAEPFRMQFIHNIIGNFTYKGQKVSELLFYIRNSNSRQEFIPLLYHLGFLEQKDLDLYDAMKSSERISWNYRQANRDMLTGPVDLTLSGYNRELHIVGHDSKLIMAELKLIKPSYDQILHAGRKLLSCKHGLKIEKFDECDIENGYFYLTAQRKTHHSYIYQIHSYSSIKQRNKDLASYKSRTSNLLKPVCPVLISNYQEFSKITIRQCKYLNSDSIYFSKLRISETEIINTKRTILEKMRLFEGPEIIEGLINITELMKTTELLCLDYNKLINTSIISFAKLVECTGKMSTDLEEEVFVMSEEGMDQTIPEYMNTSPALNIFISKTGSKHMTYKNAIKYLIRRETERFIRVFDFSGEGFFSPKNFGTLSVIKIIISMLKTNEWSTILEKTMHLCMILNDFDAQYHLLELPSYFISDPIEGDVAWVKLRSYLRTIPCPNDPLWKDIFDNFRKKAIQLMDEKIELDDSFETITERIQASFGRTEFEFN